MCIIPTKPAASPYPALTFERNRWKRTPAKTFVNGDSGAYMALLNAACVECALLASFATVLFQSALVESV